MLYIDRSSDEPLYEQLYASLVREILSGAIAAGDKLPATRKLAKELSLGRNTVDKAYQQLAAEGYVQSRTGSGFIVNPIPLVSEPQNSPDVFSSQKKEPEKSNIRYDFAYGSMDNSLFPYNQWRKSINNVLASLELREIIPYPPRMGEPQLRSEISRYLRRSRDVLCDPDQIVITCGQQHSMEIIANLFEHTEKGFAMEDPGYDGIRTVFVNHNYKLSAVPVNENGICIDALHDLCTNLLYVTPSHQFPTGGVLPIAARRHLIKWAADTDTYLIEDDYDSELRYYTNPIPSMHSLDGHQRTIYTGTFSKSLAPSMRLAYIVFPPSLIKRYKDYYQRYNTQVTPFHQLVLADFIASGNYERLINRLRTVYRKKQATLLTAIEQVFGNKVTVSGGGAGIHLLLNIDCPLSQDELIARAKRIGIRFYSTSVLYMDQSRCPKSQLLLGFPTVPESAFLEIMTSLRRVWDMDKG